MNKGTANDNSLPFVTLYSNSIRRMKVKSFERLQIRMGYIKYSYITHDRRKTLTYSVQIFLTKL